ncbi:hypothetical protein TNCV_4675101 [Trichonephila clavipes]|nr:hypothetical protein TNCV_4675101 [Trichonephila clavipes]
MVNESESFGVKGALEVVCPFRMLKVAGLIPAGFDRFSGWENGWHACHYEACKRFLENQFGSRTLGNI